MILIIGFGNVLRGDDGIGWLGANVLGSEYAADEAVEIVACQQLLPEHAEILSRADVAIFLDSQFCAEYDLRCAPLISVSPQPNSITHHLNPENLMGLARALYGRCPRSFLVSVGGASFDCGAECSRAVREKLPEMLSLTCCLVTWAKKTALEDGINCSQETAGIAPIINHSSLSEEAVRTLDKEVQGG